MTPTRAGRGRLRAGRITLALLGCLVALASRARAQRGTIETLVDVTTWKTDDSSRLLARDSGRVNVQAGLHVWGALRVTRTLELLALAHVSAGTAIEDTTEAEVERIEARLAVSRALVIQGGRILMPMGLFGARRFAHVNPVIGRPDLYPTQYPWGVMFSGAAGIIDYDAGVVSLPVVNDHYTPSPSHALRPIAGIGISAGPALRIGASVTHGPYLNRNAADLPAGTAWDDYAQTIAAANLRFSAGYMETRAELAWSRYETPAPNGVQHGLGGYLESRVTLSPRVFLATRLESFRYPFVGHVIPFPPFWVARETTERNAEVGAGYRFSPSWLLKASLRKDWWPGADPPGFPTADGYALALQLSWHAYPLEMLSGRY
jgi:hypothetical protein